MPPGTRGVARNLIWAGINLRHTLQVTGTISNLSWVKGTKQPHKKFRVDWFGGYIYTDIPPRRYGPARNGSSRRSYVLLLMFLSCLFSFLFFTVFLLFLRNFWAPSTDRRGTLPRDRKVLPFYNIRPKILGALPSKKLGAKTCKILFGSTSDNFKIRSRISSERMEISQMGKTSDRPRFLPRSAKKSGELWSTNNTVLHVDSDPPKSTFSEDHISAHRGRCRLKFSHALQDGQG